MSEPKPEYLNDALEMIGTGYDQPTVVIEPPHTTTARHNGRMVEVEEPAWVKFSTDFKKEIGLFDVYALKVFIYVGLSINWQSGEAFPGVRKIAEDARMDKGTVIQAVQWLESNNYMTVFRQEGKSNTYKPLRYFSIGTVRPDRTPAEGLSGESGELSGENEEVSGEARVNLHNKKNKIKQENTISGIEAAMFQGRKVTEEDINPVKVERETLFSFEAAFKIENGNIPWFKTKPEWTRLRKKLVEKHQSDPDYFKKYLIWYNDAGKFSGGMNVQQLRRDPEGFILALNIFDGAIGVGDQSTIQEKGKGFYA